VLGGVFLDGSRCHNGFVQLGIPSVLLGLVDIWKLEALFKAVGYLKFGVG